MGWHLSMAQLASHPLLYIRLVVHCIYFESKIQKESK
jgi:hypothetical protein